MDITAILYRNFKEKIRLTKEYSENNYAVQDLGNGLLMCSRYIILN
ncbi:flavoprotein [Clostridium lacusfryxellense]|nr:flavoprotein [Clostridium lacusfryxellense]